MSSQAELCVERDGQIPGDVRTDVIEGRMTDRELPADAVDDV
jgi:hypothetical protein